MRMELLAETLTKMRFFFSFFFKETMKIDEGKAVTLAVCTLVRHFTGPRW